MLALFRGAHIALACSGLLSKSSVCASLPKWQLAFPESYIQDALFWSQWACCILQILNM
jgi:hypothetical protein